MDRNESMSRGTAGYAFAVTFAGLPPLFLKTGFMGIRTQPLRNAMLRGRHDAGRHARLRDRFELLAPLGEGGFGTVWEGFDMLLERPVAIKELPVEGDLSDAGDALREARASARLNHPAIVSLYEMIVEDDRVYMISELVHGRTLADLIDEQMLSDADIGGIANGLCEALEHAHAHGVVHRDVKPGNVMITSTWLEGAAGWRAQPAKLMDFGIASIAGSETGRGPHAGSHGYVSPEQEAGQPATPASDVYSLALVLFECFSGAPPRDGRRARLRRARPDLPAELATCIDRCLEQDPELRPELRELVSELNMALPELSDDLRSRGLLVRLLARRARGRTGRLTRVAAGAVAAVACLVTMAVLGIDIQPLPPVAAAVAVALLPRAGWALALIAGAAALAAIGQNGSAFYLALAALPAALAVLVRFKQPLAGALWGVAAFLWAVGLQAAGGGAIVLAQPAGLPRAAELRASLPGAFDSLTQFAAVPYFASAGVWALAGAAAALLATRRAGLGWWAALAALALTAQTLVAQRLGAPVPPVSLLAASLACVIALASAASVRRGGRVLASGGGNPAALSGRTVA